MEVFFSCLFVYFGRRRDGSRFQKRGRKWADPWTILWPACCPLMTCFMFLFFFDHFCRPYHTVGDDHNGDSDNHLSGTRGLPYVAGNKWRDAVPSSLELREDDR
ncbi:hypothetical protein SAY87_023796 [Trapa incisa]|uniref:Uncharacterized protein n=1 Tax=Trapa incisa TaxID=236973 RepID=A0AAN7QU51_9MYRT|nr:hypothetical protein SAY87_023796 [Trapa incisa]